ncbi:MAG: Hsp33 family molecular chaperone HslO [Eubacteriaceae bacterium]|nr:Hsp33 family molecular chaperone HslO [Eubacteriaceae bacterium]
MADNLICATSELPIILYVADMRETVAKMAQIHNASPSAAAAAGRTLTACTIIAAMQKYDEASITCTINCDGEIGRIITVANTVGHAKCEIQNPAATFRRNEQGKIDVAGIVGSGTLTVIKDVGLDKPYIGQTPLATGEIAEDFAYYFAKSEQVPTITALGVLVDANAKVAYAGGFVLMAMPGLEEEHIAALENKINQIPPVSEMFKSGHDCASIAELLIGNLGSFQIIKQLEPSYKCDCSKTRHEKGLIALGREELQEIIDEGKDIKTHCHFCNSEYEFSIEELGTLLGEA